FPVAVEVQTVEVTRDGLAEHRAVFRRQLAVGLTLYPEHFLRKVVFFRLRTVDVQEADVTRLRAMRAARLERSLRCLLGRVVEAVGLVPEEVADRVANRRPVVAGGVLADARGDLDELVVDGRQVRTDVEEGL